MDFGWLTDWLNSCLTWLSASGAGTFTDFYAKSLRPSLFTGFLTLSVFLFSIKTFLLVTLERDVYGTDAYRARIIRLRDANPQLSGIGQLKRLSGRMFVAIISTACASASQLTIGLVDRNWSSLICVAAALVGGGMFASVLAVQRVVIRDWLEFKEEQSQQSDAMQDASDSQG